MRAFKLVKPDPDPEAVIATQDKVPDVSDCNTDVPVPGNAIGKVYVVLDAFAPALSPV